MRPSAEVIIHKLLDLVDDGRYKSRHQAQEEESKMRKYKVVCDVIVQELWKRVDARFGSSNRNRLRVTDLIAEDASGSACDRIFDKLLSQHKGPSLLDAISGIIFGLAGSGVELIPEPFLDDDFFHSGKDVLVKLRFLMRTVKSTEEMGAAGTEFAAVLKEALAPGNAEDFRGKNANSGFFSETTSALKERAESFVSSAFVFNTASRSISVSGEKGAKLEATRRVQSAGLRKKKRRSSSEGDRMKNKTARITERFVRAAR